MIFLFFLCIEQWGGGGDKPIWIKDTTISIYASNKKIIKNIKDLVFLSKNYAIYKKEGNYYLLWEGKEYSGYDSLIFLNIKPLTYMFLKNQKWYLFKSKTKKGTFEAISNPYFLHDREIFWARKEKSKWYLFVGNDSLGPYNNVFYSRLFYSGRVWGYIEGNSSKLVFGPGFKFKYSQKRTIKINDTIRIYQFFSKIDSLVVEDFKKYLLVYKKNKWFFISENKYIENFDVKPYVNIDRELYVIGRIKNRLFLFLKNRKAYIGDSILYGPFFSKNYNYFWGIGLFKGEKYVFFYVFNIIFYIVRVVDFDIVNDSIFFVILKRQDNGIIMKTPFGSWGPFYDIDKPFVFKKGYAAGFVYRDRNGYFVKIDKKVEGMYDFVYDLYINDSLYVYTYLKEKKNYLRVNGKVYGPFYAIGKLYYTKTGHFYSWYEKEHKKWYVMVDGYEIGPFDFQTKIHFIDRPVPWWFIAYRNDKLFLVLKDKLQGPFKSIENVKFFEDGSYGFIFEDIKGLYRVSLNEEVFGPFKKVEDFQISKNNYWFSFIKKGDNRRYLNYNGFISGPWEREFLYTGSNFERYIKGTKGGKQYVIFNDIAIGPASSILYIDQIKRHVLYKYDGFYYFYDGYNKFGPIKDINNLYFFHIKGHFIFVILKEKHAELYDNGKFVKSIQDVVAVLYKDKTVYFLINGRNCITMITEEF